MENIKKNPILMAVLNVVSRRSSSGSCINTG